MTVEEISLCFDIYQERQLEKTKTLAWMIYQNALLVTIGTHNPNKFPSLEETFPSLFEKKEQQDWWVMKQRIEDFKKMKNTYSE